MAQVEGGTMQGTLLRRWGGKPGLVLISFVGTYLAEPSLFLHLLRFIYLFILVSKPTQNNFF